jgi:hypothetical protein
LRTSDTGLYPKQAGRSGMSFAASITEKNPSPLPYTVRPRWARGRAGPYYFSFTFSGESPRGGRGGGVQYRLIIITPAIYYPGTYQQPKGIIHQRRVILWFETHTTLATNFPCQTTRENSIFTVWTRNI